MEAVKRYDGETDRGVGVEVGGEGGGEKAEREYPIIQICKITRIRVIVIGGHVAGPLPSRSASLIHATRSRTSYCLALKV